MAFKGSQRPFPRSFSIERKRKLHVIGTSAGGISYEKSIKGENSKRYQKKHWDIRNPFDFDHYILQ